jgi:phosphatidylglycerophosphatase A
MFVATGGGLGYLPLAPGTWGSLAGVLLYFLTAAASPAVKFALTAGVIAVAVGSAHAAEKLMRRKDAGCIVADEIAGQLVTFTGLPFHPLLALIGFVLFRLFDILKPFPIRKLEAAVPGGAGVVADDVAAGLYAQVALRLAAGAFGIP